MYLTVDEWVCLEHVRMALVFVRRFTLCQDVTKRTEEVVVPVTIHEPLGFDERYFIVWNTIALCLFHALHVLGLYHRAVILNVYLEDVTIVVVMAAVSRFALLAPHLNDTASAFVSRCEEVGVYPVTAIAKLLPCVYARAFVSRLSVDFCQTCIIVGGLGKLLAYLPETDIVYLTNKRTVPCTEVTHVVVDEEIVGLHIVSPALHLVIAPTVPLTMCHHAAYQILLHTSGIEFRHAVQLHVVLQHGTHRFCLLLLVAVASRASWFGGLAAVHTNHVTHKPTNEVGLQWYVSLREDILLLSHLLAVHTYHVAPLVAVVVTLVTLPVLAEAVHCIVVVLRLDKYLLRTRTVTMTLQPATLYAIGFIVLIWNEYLAKPM